MEERPQDTKGQVKQPVEKAAVEDPRNSRYYVFPAKDAAERERAKVVEVLKETAPAIEEFTTGNWADGAAEQAFILGDWQEIKEGWKLFQQRSPIGRYCELRVIGVFACREDAVRFVTEYHKQHEPNVPNLSNFTVVVSDSQKHREAEGKPVTDWAFLFPYNR